MDILVSYFACGEIKYVVDIRYTRPTVKLLLLKAVLCHRLNVWWPQSCEEASLVHLAAKRRKKSKLPFLNTPNVNSTTSNRTPPPGASRRTLGKNPL